MNRPSSKQGQPPADMERVVTAKLPGDLVLRLDCVAARIDRSKNWIVRQAVGEWIAEEERRHDLSLEDALNP